MPKPLRSDDPSPRSVQFSHFGVLDDGARSKGAAVTSLVVNSAILLFAIIVGSVVHHIVTPPDKKDLTFVPVTEPPVKPPPPPPPVKLPPPPKLPEPPKIKIPEPIKPPPPEMKPIEVPRPKPLVDAPAPKKVTPPPAPVKVNLGTQAAAVPNHDAHPSAVKLGQTDNPLKSLTGKPVSNVNLGQRGVPGMSAQNVGNGPQAAKVVIGGGCPNCQDMSGHYNRGVARVEGLGNGVQGGTGKAPYRAGVQQVQIGLPPAQQARPVQAIRSVAANAPTVTYKPTPVYSAEAKAMHLEGNVAIRIRVMPNGAVQVLGLVRGLGHGLDQSAMQAISATRFKPATDASGRPVEWEGVVDVNFQMS